MTRALVISLLFWVVVVPGAIGSFLIVRFLVEAECAVHFLFTFALGVTILAAALGPLLFPFQIATEFDRSFDDSKITNPGGHKC